MIATTTDDPGGITAPGEGSERMTTTNLDGATWEDLNDRLDRLADDLRMIPVDQRDTEACWDMRREAGEIRGLLRPICNNCGRAGAEDQYDREGIYAGRWHDRCATASDRRRAAYRHHPGEDEPLEGD